MNESFRKTEVQVTDQFGGVNLVFWLYQATQRTEIDRIVNLAKSGLFRVEVALSLHVAQDTRYFAVENLGLDQFGNLEFWTNEWSDEKNSPTPVHHIVPASSFDKLCYISLVVK